MCNGLEVSDLKHLADKISSMESFAQSHPAMEKVFLMLLVLIYFVFVVCGHTVHGHLIKTGLTVSMGY